MSFILFIDRSIFPRVSFRSSFSYVKIFLEFASPLLFLIFRNIEIEIIIDTFYRDKIFDRAYKALEALYYSSYRVRSIDLPPFPSFICSLYSSFSYFKISIPSSNLDTRIFQLSEKLNQL